jgi:hypothetical protein
MTSRLPQTRTLNGLTFLLVPVQISPILCLHLFAPYSCAMDAPELPNDPSEIEPYRQFPLFLYSFKACSELRDCLKVTDESDARIAFASQRSKPREQYLLLAVNEVEKILYKIIGMFSHEGYKSNQKHAPLAIESMREEQAAWKRKLIELLVELASFGQTNHQINYRHLLGIREYNSVLSVWRDWKEFYACENLNHRSTLRLLDKNIRTTEGNLELDSCWYLKDKRPWSKRNDDDKLYSLVSFHKQLKSILSSLQPYERLFIGLTYNRGFGLASTSIHASVGSLRGVAHEKEMSVAAGITDALLGCMQCIIRITTLGHLQEKVEFASFLDAFDGNEIAAEIYKEYVDSAVQIGEIARVPGGSAMVMRVLTSDYGYKSYQVAYSGKPPLPDIPIDTFIAPHVELQFDQDHVADELAEKLQSQLGDLTEGFTSEDIREMGKEAIQNAINQFMQMKNESGQS